MLVAGIKEEALSPAMQKKYCSETRKTMHAMQYSRPEMYHAVQDLSCHMHKATQEHYKAMLRVLKYSVDTVEQGLVLKPNAFPFMDSSNIYNNAIFCGYLRGN